MTPEDVLRLAREAGFQTGKVDLASGTGSMPFAQSYGDWCFVELQAFAKLVAAAERQECARVSESVGRDLMRSGRLQAGAVSKRIADAILARGAEPGQAIAPSAPIGKD